ncbi:MAG: glycosyltransferase [Flavobacteriaceae bacterium]|nr:glycosyltransferase [Flavobacteriaceae bacterium]
MFMISISILFFFYLLIISLLSYGFDKVNKFSTKNHFPRTKFTVVVPYRNEAVNLPELLHSIAELNYPTSLVDFIFVDDDSNDNSTAIIHEYTKENDSKIKVISNERISNSPKKDAITLAIKTTTNDWILTTDADCILSKNWLITIDNYIQEYNCNMLVAPVTYQTNNSFLHQFQFLDFLSLQASTVGGFGIRKPFLSNGANLAYKKEIFTKVDGFENNYSIASGDDIFLLEKFIQLDKTKVKYLKSFDAIVKTQPVNTTNDLIQQRVRWASKSAKYKLPFGKIIGIIILFGNMIIALSPVLYLYNYISIYAFIGYFLMKLFFDFLLIERMSKFYKQPIAVGSYLASSIVYPYFTILVFFISLFGNYQWKGRDFKK